MLAENICIISHSQPLVNNWYLLDFAGETAINFYIFHFYTYNESYKRHLLMKIRSCIRCYFQISLSLMMVQH